MSTSILQPGDRVVVIGDHCPATVVRTTEHGTVVVLRDWPTMSLGLLKSEIEYYRPALRLRKAAHKKVRANDVVLTKEQASRLLELLQDAKLAIDVSFLRSTQRAEAAAFAIDTAKVILHRAGAIEL